MPPAAMSGRQRADVARLSARSALRAAWGLPGGREAHEPRQVIPVARAPVMRLAATAHIALAAVSQVRESHEDTRRVPGVLGVKFRGPALARKITAGASVTSPREARAPGA